MFVMHTDVDIFVPMFDNTGVLLHSAVHEFKIQGCVRRHILAANLICYGWMLSLSIIPTKSLVCSRFVYRLGFAGFLHMPKFLISVYNIYKTPELSQKLEIC